MNTELSTGTVLSHYRITSKIGAGGMGVVYRASDTRLDRDVAIKVLPADLANHPERLQRFEQEARSTSALNHPNILTVYDIGNHEGAPYIVAELREGHELRAEIEARYPRELSDSELAIPDHPGPCSLAAPVDSCSNSLTKRKC